MPGESIQAGPESHPAQPPLPFEARQTLSILKISRRPWPTLPASTTFHLFSMLPVELRLEVWEYAITAEAQDRIVVLRSHSPRYHVQMVPLKYLASPFLSVSREVRFVARSIYTERIPIFAADRIGQESLLVRRDYNEWLAQWTCQDGLTEPMRRIRGTGTVIGPEDYHKAWSKYVDRYMRSTGKWFPIILSLDTVACVRNLFLDPGADWEADEAFERNLPLYLRELLVDLHRDSERFKGCEGIRREMRKKRWLSDKRTA